MSTYEINTAPGMGHYVIERRHDGQLWPSTQRDVRCVAGPYTTADGARERQAELEKEQTS